MTALLANLVRAYCRNAFTYRTNTCGELTMRHVGNRVTLCGWLSRKRMNKFLLLRDAYGTVQLTVEERLFSRVKALTKDSVIKVTGTVVARPGRDVNPDMTTGQVEVVADSLEVLNVCKRNLPVSVGDWTEAGEMLRLRYRYLDLRRQTLQANLRLRARLIREMRNVLDEKHGLLEVETPTLFCRTPGGAKEFLVPSRHPGRFFCLPQSPQQFKQLLMVAGFDRYYQIARCYRDEGAKSDRQPEFTQVDLELSFADENGVMALVESLIHDSWPEDVYQKPKVPFSRIRYEDAMRLYGTDKPDRRFDWTLVNFDHLCHGGGHCSAFFAQSLDGQVLPQPSAQEMDHMRRHLIAYHQHTLAHFEVLTPEPSSENLPISNSVRRHFNRKDGLVVVACSDSAEKVWNTLGNLRILIADHYETNLKVRIRRDQFDFLWVVEFPLFLRNASGNLESAHHPFTAPAEGQEELLYTDPCKVLGRHYDLVLNGVELGGGSVRIHQACMQRYVLEEVLKESAEPLAHMIEALDSGAPPHAGFALGLDRYVALLTRCSSIRDVIAFPKSHACADPMTGAPNRVDDATLERYHIDVRSTPTIERVNF